MCALQARLLLFELVDAALAHTDALMRAIWSTPHELHHDWLKTAGLPRLCPSL